MENFVLSQLPIPGGNWVLETLDKLKCRITKTTPTLENRRQSKIATVMSTVVIYSFMFVKRRKKCTVGHRNDQDKTLSHISLCYWLICEH